MDDSSFNDAPENQKELAGRIFYLVIGRVFKDAYLRLPEAGQQSMNQVFVSGTTEEKAAFMKREIADFPELFTKELEKVQQELAAEMQKEFQ